MKRIDPKKYATPTEASQEVGKPRTTLLNAAERDEIDTVETFGGTLLMRLASVAAWVRSRETITKSR